MIYLTDWEKIFFFQVQSTTLKNVYSLEWVAIMYLSTYVEVTEHENDGRKEC